MADPLRGLRRYLEKTSKGKPFYCSATYALGTDFGSEVRLSRGHSTVHVGHFLVVCGIFTNLTETEETFVYTFNLTTEQWRKVSVDMVYVTRAHHSAVLVDDKVVIYGGRANWVKTSDILVLDLVLMEFVNTAFKGDVPAVAFHSADYLPCRKAIIVFGGELGSGGYGATYAVNLNYRSFVKLKTDGAPPSPRSMHASAVVGKEIFVVGGYNGGFLPGLFVLSFKYHDSGMWSTVQTSGNVPSGRTFSCMNYFHNVLVLYGGFYDGRGHADMYVISPEKGKWNAVLKDGVQVSKPVVGTQAQRNWPTLFDHTGTVVENENKVVYIKEGRICEVRLHLGT